MVLAAVTTLAFLTGNLEVTNYYATMGLPAGSLDFSSDYYLNQSAPTLAVPLVLFIGYVVADSYWTARNAPARGSLLFGTCQPAAMAFIVSAAWAGYNLAAWLESLPNLPPTMGSFIAVRVLGALAILLALGLGALVARRQWLDRDTAHPTKATSYLFGRTRSAHLYLAVVSAIALFGAAVLHGQDRADEARSGCQVEPRIVFHPTPTQDSGLDSSHDYWVIAHQNGFYYLRDFQTPAKEHPVLVVSDQPGANATIHWQAPRNCTAWSLPRAT